MCLRTARRYHFAAIRHPLLGAEASAMRTTWPGSWLRYLLVWVGLVFVLAGWVIVTIAGLVATDSATAIRWARARLSSSRPGARFWQRLGSALFFAFLVVVWFVVAITYPFPPLVTFGSIPVLTYVLFRVAQGPAYNDPFGRRPRGPAFPARGQSIVFRPASFDLRGREPVFPPGTSQFAVRQHPLWDRWIDG
jgi:hypothetical protein